MPYHPISPAELKSLVICGMAVAMMSLSRETRNMPTNMHAKRRTSLRPVG